MWMESVSSAESAALTGMACKELTILSVSEGILLPLRDILNLG